VDDCLIEDEIKATSGDVAIHAYGDNILEGAFNITLENGDSLTGTFDVYF
jgi:hypothetical protein